MKYNVYEITPTCNYSGVILVGAKDAEKANEIIDNRLKNDPNNKYNSFAFDHVTEEDKVDGLFTEEEWIVLERTTYMR